MVRSSRYSDIFQDLHLWRIYHESAAKYNNEMQSSSSSSSSTLETRKNHLKNLDFQTFPNTSSLTPTTKSFSGMMLTSWLISNTDNHLQSYDARNDIQKYGENCEALGHIFYQGDCPACFAFAFASTLGSRICLRGMSHSIMPSPYRIFDCAGNACEDADKGLNALMVKWVMKDGVPDLRETPPIFGWGCQTGRVKSHAFKEICGVAWIKRELFLNGPVIMPVDLIKLKDMQLTLYNEWDDLNVRFLSSSSSSDTLFIEKEDTKPPEIAMHALMVMGWGQHPTPHWILKNSWGSEWGKSGVGRVPWSARDCAFAFEPSITAIKNS